MVPTPPLEVITIEETHSTVLTTPAKTVAFPLSHENCLLIEAMKNKLHQLGGVGLAAPQVNENKQIVAIYIPESATLLRDQAIPYPMHILINPSYKTDENPQIVSDFEGCYSVASKAGKVPRYHTITLTYQDETGQYHTQIESGFYARVLQHEIDHLNGILITDRLTPDCIQGSLEQIMSLRRQALSPEQQVLFDELMRKKLHQKNQ